MENKGVIYIHKPVLPSVLKQHYVVKLELFEQFNLPIPVWKSVT